jgi:phosphatidylethanolamine-binding protein (PEBP) family uncharacterized protein
MVELRARARFSSPSATHPGTPATHESGAGGGSTLRWNVADISPSVTSVAEGKTPTGGVLGANSEGHNAYGRP